MGAHMGPKEASAREMDMPGGTMGYPKDGELYVEMGGKEVPVALAILSTFKPSPGNSKYGWKNGNKLDNRLENLFWVINK